MSFYKGVMVLTAAVAFSACSRASQPASEGSPAATAGADAVQINGMGATFPNPIYSKWFTEYNRLHPSIQINYQSQGSGAGIRGLSSKTVFFGASDQPMNAEQLKSAGSTVLHLPTVMGAVVPVYNLPDVSQELKFSGPVLADIVLGRITKWNDPALVKLNQGVNLPNTPITFVHRSDGSGTTFIFLDFLAKVSPELKAKVGANASVSWPVGVGGKGNEGVAGLVSQTPGTLGYVELIYALQNKIAYGSVQNSEGAFVKPSIESVTAAADSAASTMPEDFRVSITNPPGAASYPIGSFTWILMYENPDDKQKAKVMVDFMKWALTEGQQSARELGYAPLPKNVVDMEMKALNRIQVQ
jgi:phosphate transport system substrate-binding protein